LKNVVDVHGAGQLGVLATPLSTLEELYLAARLARGLGTEHIDHRLRRSISATGRHPVAAARLRSPGSAGRARSAGRCPHGSAADRTVCAGRPARNATIAHQPAPLRPQVHRDTLVGNGLACAAPGVVLRLRQQCRSQRAGESRSRRRAADRRHERLAGAISPMARRVVLLRRLPRTTSRT
jgi:hypothetical protein